MEDAAIPVKTYLWKILGLIVLGLLVFWFVLKASGSPNTTSNLHIVTSSLPLPLLPQIPVQFYTNTWYFAATAQDNHGLESDFSSEVSVTNVFSDTNPPIFQATLAWDPSPGTNVITNYSVYWGSNSRIYTNFVSDGTNLTVVVPLLKPPPPPLTNCVLKVTTTGTNLYRATSLKGLWSALNTTNYTVTNLPAPCYFRGKGSRGNTVSISSRMQ